MNLRRIIILHSLAPLMLFPSSVLAQTITELNGNTDNGISIDSNANNDFPGDEYFIVRDSSSTVFYGDGDVQTNVVNQNNISLEYDEDDDSSGSFALTTGGANVLTSNNAGTVTVHNSMVANGIDNGTDGITNAGAVSGVTTLGVTGATTMSNTLAVDSNGATAGGAQFTVNNNGHTLSHVDGTATNAVTIADTQQATVGLNSFNYGTRIDGGALVEGDLGVNGSIYALNPTANTGINVGNNGIAIDGSSNTTALIADSNSNANDGRAEITLQEDSATMLVHNEETGEAHGVAINQSQTVVSGGTQSTSLTLNDNGATFRNTTTGGPARVTGVADGMSKFDAVNYGQLQEAHAGIASVAAMANIPRLAEGKNFTIGLGYGHFDGQDAFAVGGMARLDENISFQASVGHSDDSSSVGAGLGFSW